MIESIQGKALIIQGIPSTQTTEAMVYQQQKYYGQMMMTEEPRTSLENGHFGFSSTGFDFSKRPKSAIKYTKQLKPITDFQDDVLQEEQSAKPIRKTLQEFAATQNDLKNVVLRDYKGKIQSDIFIDYDDIMMVNGRKVDGGTSERFIYVKNEISANQKQTPTGRSGQAPVGQFSKVYSGKPQANPGNQLSQLVSHNPSLPGTGQAKPLYEVQIAKKLDLGYKRRFTEKRKIDRNFENSRKRTQLIELRKKFSIGSTKRSMPETSTLKLAEALRKGAGKQNFANEVKKVGGRANARTQFVDDLAMYSDQNLALNDQI